MVRPIRGPIDPSDLPERLLTIREIAEILSVSRATVYSLIERRELDHVRVSNAIRIRPENLVRYLSRDDRG